MPPSLDCPDAPSDTGAYRIAWSVDADEYVFLYENDAPLYEGQQSATTVSGRPAGEYVYRLGIPDEHDVSWKDSCTVVVAPPSLSLAFFLFGVGLTVFASLVLVVVRGHRAHRRGELSG